MSTKKTTSTFVSKNPFVLPKKSLVSSLDPPEKKKKEAQKKQEKKVGSSTITTTTPPKSCWKNVETTRHQLSNIFTSSLASSSSSNSTSTTSSTSSSSTYKYEDEDEDVNEEDVNEEDVNEEDVNEEDVFKPESPKHNDSKNGWKCLVCEKLAMSDVLQTYTSHIVLYDPYWIRGAKNGYCGTSDKSVWDILIKQQQRDKQEKAKAKAKEDVDDDYINDNFDFDMYWYMDREHGFIYRNWYQEHPNGNIIQWSASDVLFDAFLELLNDYRLYHHS